jgi:rare lipoprotein A
VHAAEPPLLQRDVRQPGLILALVASCGAAADARPVSPTSSVSVAPARPGVFQKGYATWYGKALAGHKTASGERFDPSKLTAAHRTLKLGTWVDVRRTDNGRVVRVRINDRGPVSHRFVIDLSSEAARRLGMLRMGVAPVELRIVRP